VTDRSAVPSRFNAGEAIPTAMPKAAAGLCIRKRTSPATEGGPPTSDSGGAATERRPAKGVHAVEFVVEELPSPSEAEPSSTTSRTTPDYAT
jgi:hypothetical protein